MIDLDVELARMRRLLGDVTLEAPSLATLELAWSVDSPLVPLLARVLGDVGLEAIRPAPDDWRWIDPG